MKLETKFQDKDFELGEVVKAKVTTYYDENKVVVMADRARGGVSRFEYNSIKDFTDHWEDAPEEPKEHWIINAIGGIETTDRDETDEPGRAMIEIGNYFETEEEAEKAVERLRAWKRLKDKGFRFEYYDYSDRDLHNHIQIKAITNREIEDSMLYKEDLDLLFGGE